MKGLLCDCPGFDGMDKAYVTPFRRILIDGVLLHNLSALVAISKHMRAEKLC